MTARHALRTSPDSTARLGTQVSIAAAVDDSAHRLHAALTATRTCTDQYDWFCTLDFTLASGATRFA
jgi:hypothetical protein